MERDKTRMFKGKFIRLMYEKGYRGKFFLDMERQRQMAMQDELPACLEEIIKATQDQQMADNRFDLDTTTIEGIRCTFRVSFDDQKGFLVRKMTIEDKESNEKKFFRLDNNHQIAGARAVEDLFPKPKPWDHIIRGKLRP